MLSNENPTLMREAGCNDDKIKAIDLYRLYFPNVGKVMREIGHPRTLFYRWKLDDPEFAARVKDIETEVMGELEENLISQGRLDKRSLGHLCFTLKNWMPEKYGDKLETSNTTTIIDLSDQADKTLERASELLKATDKV